MTSDKKSETLFRQAQNKYLRTNRHWKINVQIIFGIPSGTVRIYSGEVYVTGEDA